MLLSFATRNVPRVSYNTNCKRVLNTVLSQNDNSLLTTAAYLALLRRFGMWYRCFLLAD